MLQSAVDQVPAQIEKLKSEVTALKKAQAEAGKAMLETTFKQLGESAASAPGGRWIVAELPQGTDPVAAREAANVLRDALKSGAAVVSIRGVTASSRSRGRDGRSRRGEEAARRRTRARSGQGHRRLGRRQAEPRARRRQGREQALRKLSTKRASVSPRASARRRDGLARAGVFIVLGLFLIGGFLVFLRRLE